MEGVSLQNNIDKLKVECLNENHDHPLSHIWPSLTNNNSSSSVPSVPYLASADDAELIVKVGFLQAVKLTSIRINTKSEPSRKTSSSRSALGGDNNNSSSDDHHEVDVRYGPKVVKLFTNNLYMGFSECGSDLPVQELLLTQDNLRSSEPISLRFVKFQNVSSLTIFIESNQNDEDETRITSIDLYGSTADNMNMKDWRPLKDGEKVAADDS